MAKNVRRVPVRRRRGASELEVLLLEAAREDGPPNDAARARTLAAVKAASHATAAVGMGLLVSRWLSKIGPTAAKWFLVAGIGTAASVGAATFLSGHEPASAAAAASAQVEPATPFVRGRPATPAARLEPATPAARVETATPPARVEPATPMARSEPATPTARNEHAAPSARVEAATPAPTSSASLPATAGAPAGAAATAEASSALSAATPPSTAPAPSSLPTPLRDETALLESVREALAASQVNRALATLDRYDAAFAPGVLAEEAAVLRVTALMAGGKRAQARRLAEDFARRYPTSSYGPRVRALVETNF